MNKISQNRPILIFNILRLAIFLRGILISNSSIKFAKQQFVKIWSHMQMVQPFLLYYTKTFTLITDLERCKIRVSSIIGGLSNDKHGIAPVINDFRILHISTYIL